MSAWIYPMTALALHLPNPTFRIRPLAAQDWTALRADCWREHPEAAAQDLFDHILQRMAQNSGVGVVVLGETPNTVVAYGQVTRWVHCGEISDLIVSEARRSQGVGTALIQHLVYIAASHFRMPCVDIGAAVANPRALALYQRLGFQRAYDMNLDLGAGAEKVIYLRLALPR